MTKSAGETDGSASANLPVQDPWFEVTQLSPDLFRITEPRCHKWVRANCFLILGRERDILVDSGMGIAALRSALDRLSSRPRLVFTTHVHVDHVGSHPEFADCEILVHPVEADALAQPGQQGLRFSKRSAEAIASSGMGPSEFMIEAVPFAELRPRDVPPGAGEADTARVGRRHRRNRRPRVRSPAFAGTLAGKHRALGAFERLALFGRRHLRRRHRRQPPGFGRGGLSGYDEAHCGAPGHTGFRRPQRDDDARSNA